MENKIDIEVIEFYTYEIIERIHRFITHLEEIENQFYIDDSTASDKLNFIQSYKESLYKILEIVIIGLNDFKDNKLSENRYLDIQLKSIAAINELHSQYLSILPRPLEPVELARFRRVIYKQIVQLNKSNKQDISISINEKIGEEIDIDPLHDFRTDFINKLVTSFNEGKENGIKDIVEIDDAKRYITIPRIDASNTFRWSSLIHEMCHSLMDLIEFENNSIEEDFLKFINEDKMIKDFFSQNIPEVKFSPINKTLKSWLNECWCDTFACILIGPSLYFSQYLTFINDQNNACKTHPPALFRLYLIEAIISSNRFPKELSIYLENKYLKHCEKVLLKYQNPSYLNFENCHQLSPNSEN